MGSMLKTYSDEKLKGKVYTPDFIVSKMLDEIDFVGQNILGKKILDPACGDGQFLKQIVKRIIEISPIQELKTHLENVYGWDIDPVAVSKCIDNLNRLVKPYNIQIDWKIEVKNSLYVIEYFSDSLFSLDLNFDFIVGNPPYIRIQHLDDYQRKYIQQNYSFCQKGSTDIYIAFFELCFHLLNDNGIGALITPNTFFYTQTAEKLRKYIKQHQNIRKISNYKHIQLFENATTYSAITIFTKTKNSSLIYEEFDSLQHSKIKKVSYSQLLTYPFFNFNIEKHTKGKKLKDICKIGVGITTLNDKAYIFNNLEHVDDKYCYVNSYYKNKIKIEKSILKPIIKGSTFKGDNGHPKEFILFPYQKVNNKHQIIEENYLKKNFPLAYQYLLSIKDVLDKRDNGKPNPVAWYAFGRHQSLDSAFGKKIIFSPMNKYPNFILSELEDCTLYSGYYIKYDGDYNLLLQQLNSDRMHQYISSCSRDFRDGWKAYNKKVLEEFEVFI